MRKLTVLAIVLGLGCFSTAAGAATITIDFDTNVEPSLFNQSTALTTQLAGTGVTWDGGGAILDQAGNFSVTGFSPRNFLAYNSNATFENGDPVQHIDSLFLAGSASGVSFNVGGPNVVFFATAFDSAFAVVDSIANLVLTSALQTVTLSGLGIVRVDYGLSQGPLFVLDDLEVRDFEAVPEPATLLLFGTGLAAAGMRRRMKKRG